VKSWIKRLALTFGVWLVISAGVGLAGGAAHPLLLALYVGVVAVLVFLFLDVSAQTRPIQWPKPRQEPVRERGEDPRLDQLRRVVAQHLDSREVGEALQRHLAEIADHRLVVRHGITREADPDTASRLLGAELSAVLDRGAPYPRLTIDQMDLLLQRIEAI
jgi:hypothetical protein